MGYWFFFFYRVSFSKLISRERREAEWTFHSFHSISFFFKETAGRPILIRFGVAIFAPFLVLLFST